MVFCQAVEEQEGGRKKCGLLMASIVSAGHHMTKKEGSGQQRAARPVSILLQKSGILMPLMTYSVQSPVSAFYLAYANFQPRMRKGSQPRPGMASAAVATPLCTAPPRGPALPCAWSAAGFAKSARMVRLSWRLCSGVAELAVAARKEFRGSVLVSLPLRSPSASPICSVRAGKRKGGSN